MIFGVGTDIMQISRMRTALSRTPALMQRILTPTEQKACNDSSDPALFMAKRFAAKEAVVKALGTGIGRGVSWQHVEVTHNSAGQPQVVLSGGAQKLSVDQGVVNVHLSYSDEKDYIVAFAVAEKS